MDSQSLWDSSESSPAQRPLGWVPTVGQLPFWLIHGESLVAAASWALTTAGVDLYDAAADFALISRSGRALVVHDPACPLTPPAFLAEAAALSSVTDEIVVGFQPVTDSIKQLTNERFTGSWNRDELRMITSPLVLPPRVLQQWDQLELAELSHVSTSVGLLEIVAQLASLPRQVQLPIRWLTAPALARRISTQAELRVLEAMSDGLGADAQQ